MSSVFARRALLPGGWADDVMLRWDARGDLVEVRVGEGADDGVPVVGSVLPGMVNLHSHAFQRALGGLTERAGDREDSFWTWRELMYRFAEALSPDDIEAIAAQLYVECLRHGYTSVCEFHYLQRDRDGAAYARPAEAAERVLAAARTAGIGITLLPALYCHAGFGERPLLPEQRRFRSDVHDVLRVIEALEPTRDAQTEVGAAPHSLRAATTVQLRALVERLPADRPLHIHIAEQQAEVVQCQAAHGLRPVELLLRELPVDTRWCLVHATHLVEPEIQALAHSGAVVGLCPTTEANLGDGLFPLAPFLAAGGRFGVGSDSHVSRSPIEELRWLEYGQRLLHQRRNVASSPEERRVGDLLWQVALDGGARAAGRRVGALEPGRRADLLVLDDGHPVLDGVSAEDLLGCLVFSGNDNLVRDVLVGGRWVVREGKHAVQAEVAARYGRTMRALRARGR